MDHIRLRDIIIYGHYGVTGPEREVGQRLLMDLDLELDLTRPAETDQLGDTVSYEEVYLAAQHLAGGRRCKLLEHLAAVVADGMLAQFAILEVVTVSLRKMSLPFPNTCREVEVVFTRRRTS